MEKGFLLVAVWSPSVFPSVGCYFPIVHAGSLSTLPRQLLQKNRKVTAAWTRSIDMFIITVIWTHSTG